MNTSGPSSRPRNPYPLALLNHLTVPFNRSTCAPLFFANVHGKAQIPGFRKNCVGIVLLSRGTVKAWHYTLSVILGAGSNEIVTKEERLTGWAGRLRQP